MIDYLDTKICVYWWTKLEKSTDKCKDNMFIALKKSSSLLVGDMCSPHIESKYSFYFYIHLRYSLPK